MANIKSAIKKKRKDKRRTARNRVWRSRVRTLARKVDDLLAQKGASPEEIEKSLGEAQKNLDKAAKRGVIHPNKAARLKSSLAKKVIAAETAHGAKKPQSS